MKDKYIINALMQIHGLSKEKAEELSKLRRKKPVDCKNFFKNSIERWEDENKRD